MRNYEKKLAMRLSADLSHRDFLIARLKSEWEQIQREAKREKLVAMAKGGAIVAGKTMLVLAASLGILTVAAVAPNLFAAFGKMTHNRGFFDKRNFNRAKATLKSRGYIKIQKPNKGDVKILITEKGLNKVLLDGYKDLKIQQPQKWDGKWRMIIFDIPERHKWAREGFREKLRLLGFYHLQESVFAHPYSCEDELRFIANVFSINNYINFFVTDKLDNVEKLKRYFNL